MSYLVVMALMTLIVVKAATLYRQVEWTWMEMEKPTLILSRTSWKTTTSITKTSSITMIGCEL